MADRLIGSTGGSGLRALGANGQLVVDSHRQLAAILRNRLGAAHAALLSRPERAADQARIDWYGAGPATAFSALAPDALAAARAKLDQRRTEIEGLADRLAGEGEASALVAHLLRLAVTTPGEAYHYLVGGEPVLIAWGHAGEAQAVPAMPAKAPVAAPPAPPPTVVSAAAAEPAATTTAGGRRWPGGLGWLLPLLLLIVLALLLLKACEPLSPIVTEHDQPPQAAPDPTAEETQRQAALTAELDALKKQLADQQAGLCVLPPPKEEPPKKVEPPPEPPKVEPAKPEPPKAEPPPAPLPAEKPAAPKPPPPKAEAPPPKPAEPPPTKAPPAQAQNPPPQSCPGQRPKYDAPEAILVVDGSGSMDDPFPGAASRMDMSKKAIAQVVRDMPSDVDIGLVDFTDCDNVKRQDFYAPADRGRLIGDVNAMRPDRGTPLARAIERAANIASGDVETSLIIVTDGEDTCRGDPCAAARAAKARKPRMTISVIDLDDSGHNPTAQCIAQASGGKVYKPNSPVDFVRSVKQAAGAAAVDCK